MVSVVKKVQPTFTVKLVLIVVAMILGVMVLALFTWKGLDNVQKSSHFVFKVGEGKDQIRQLQLRMILLETEGDQKLAEVEQQESIKLQQLAKFIEDAKARSYLNDIQVELKKYSRQLQLTHQVEKQLGDDKSGLISELDKIGSKLEESLTGKRSALRQFTKMRQMEKEFLLSPEKALVARLDSQYKQLERAAKRGRVYVPNKAVFQQFKQQLDSMKILAISYHTESGKLKKIQEIFGTLVIDTLKYMEHDLQVVAQKNSVNSVKSAELSILIGTPVLALTLMAMLSWIGIGVRRNLGQVVKLMKSIASGDLTPRLHPNMDRNDEFDQLADMANQMAADLQEIIRRVVHTGHRLTEMSEQLDKSICTIAEANTEVSEQSSTLASSTEEISVTTDEVANTSENLSALSKDVHTIANNNEQMITDVVSALGNATSLVGEANNSLEDLAEKSKSIDQVVELINGITEQTNLLALNAAIEAARAGDAGRGFAVVADEVRGLATHTVKATSQITEIVELIQVQVDEVSETTMRSSKGVDKASELGEEVHQSIQTIEERSDEVSEAVQQLVVAITEIAKTSRDMATRMDSIAKNVDSNRQATQQILGVVETINSDAHELDRLTQRFTYE
ncbi:methyl-accepting chemotaxis protein [Vibrio salinus]|uniref:methyl-accepting chemotaxis protein n=1 Tax=Vibrio salinus TaxID=2899784 RepID=UPI001E5DA439|nr:HAMP domain-containing methyl-accepting chemotaxis protein [Vibrio salinus]MCE0495214.1 methyl-accepting chemotaxis protein [Vibrio salinus]